MFVRYGAGEDGGLRKKALVYVRDEHGIQRNSISGEALRILERLRGSGHAAYVVGGAVRDLLVGRRPKDFDIVTDATPGRIKKLFWNSRIIGRRFRLVHVFFEDRIYEVATFRSLKDGSVGNDYGTMDEDVMRRDYTMNALYYDPKDETIVDYVGGFRDIKRGIIRALIPPERIFKEDPVRMLRAAKYAASTGFAVPFALKRRIRSEARLLGDASTSRLTEELTKIISSGKSRAIAERLLDLRLLSYVLPAAASRCASKVFRVSFLDALSELDASVPEKGDSPQGLQLSFLLALLIDDAVDWSLDPIEAYPMAVQAARDALSPMNLPRVEVECAVRFVFRRRGIPLLQRHMRPRDESRQRDETRERGEPRRREGPSKSDGRGRGDEAKRDRSDPAGEDRPAGDSGRRRKRRGRGRGRKPGGGQQPDQGEGGAEGAKP